MNENVCRLCRRYAERPSSGVVRGWLCAKTLWTVPSEVIPEHSYWERDNLHPMWEARRIPPDWCEKPLEQVILKPDVKPDMRPDDNARLVHDGNVKAEMHVRERCV